MSREGAERGSGSPGGNAHTPDGCGGYQAQDVLWRTAVVDPDAARALAARLCVPERVACWLLARDIADPDAWLRPGLHVGQPCAFTDMARAVERVRWAVQAGERVAVMGDYDVDGVTAAAIAWTALTRLGADCRVILPHRVRDGYGLTPALVDRAREAGARLLLTVDNGVRAAEAVAYARAHGLDVIVTDHHEPGDDMQRAAALWHGVPVVHWCRASHPWVRDLSGAGVAWTFARALLGDALDQPLAAGAAVSLGDWLAALAALGTLADVMPLTGANRGLVKHGLAVLRTVQHPGWLALCREAGVDPAWLGEDDLMWSIIPRLNAAGRMDSAEDAMAVLLAEDPAAAAAAAARVGQWHALRRRETERAVAEALAWCRAAPPQAGGLVVSGAWPLGVAGIVAAKLAEVFGCAAVVLCDDGSEVLRGSGRGPAGVSVYQVLSACCDGLDGVAFGGHEAAVGCHVRRDVLAEFSRRVAACPLARPGATAGADGGETAPAADDVLPLAEANEALWPWVEAMGPFGPGNPPLTFYIGPVVVERVVPMGDGSHARIHVREQGIAAEWVWFRAPAAVFHWQPGAVAAAVVTLHRNAWQGRVRYQWRVVRAWRLRGVLTREDFAYVYRLLRARRRLLQSELGNLGARRSEREVALALDTFVELGFAERTDGAYHVVEAAQPRDLRESRRYQRHLWAAVRRAETRGVEHGFREQNPFDPGFSATRDPVS
ncbi:hypothetical protein GCM10010885_14050 [Alicyclobacillus cellulosilyticus]|uniref:Single-stranded-DNA-specific exonuclease RecJ n=1 Tax=Alicyclobacillus cellulosilyticus TaxID=1003997 RepID=A0A917KBR1_9BACL|nr:single-stranded-DNA-specific exonuclease C-terminal domain-containing protein [Alicyclobacillus cellulosilyticus]GGJ06061.1 hypothetical protein GCM10010885_14050 [Alicyclobacillus cellulosilyticus]